MLDPDRDTDYRLDPQRLAQMQGEVLEINKINGWFEDGRSFEEGIALLHTEVAEMVEAYRRWGMEDATGRDCPCSPESMQVSPAHLCKPEGVGSEMADVLIRLLDESYRQGVDMGKGVRSLNDPQHSFTRVTNGLHRAVARLDSEVATLIHGGASPETVERHLEQGMTGICGDLQSAAHWWKIDLEAEYERKIAYNFTRGFRHGGKRL